MRGKASVAEGLCGCGCGGRTEIAQRTRANPGWVKGRPKRFLVGHARAGRPVSGAPYAVEDRGHDTPCWVWLRSRAGGRYAKLSVGGRTVLAHRHYYERQRGAIPEGRQLDHLCRVVACVNPWHLEPVTGTENVRRGDGARLSVAVAGQIRRRYAAGGASQRALAAEVGTDQAMVSRIVNGLAWVPEEVA